MENKITKVMKRDGTIVGFEQRRIQEAIFKALTATGQGDGDRSRKLSDRVIQFLNRRFKKEEIPTVEQIQDIVEEVLILEGLVETAKAYILYREQRRRIREATALVDESTEMVDKYLQELDWQVHENANMAYSLQGLNQYIISTIAKKYWLNKIYPKEIREAALNEDFHIHNLEIIACYCMGWDLYDLLLRGFGGVPSKLECRPPKHLGTALGQLVNFFFTLQGESAGAQAVSNFDTLLAPFVRYDRLSYLEVKQAMQEFLYNCMVPTRVGFQSLAWDEPIIIKHKGKIKFIEIGRLIDKEFEENSHRVIEQHPQSYAVQNYDDYYTLSFDSQGRAIWAKVKAFIRHRVPKDSKFLKIRTNRGVTKVSPAHSLFSFSKFDGTFNPKAVSAQDINTRENYRYLSPKNHFLALKSLMNSGDKEELDLIELIDEIPQLHKNVFAKINPTRTIKKIKENIFNEYQGFLPFWRNFGFRDRGVWQQCLETQSVRYDVWRKFSSSSSDAQFKLKNSDIWYPRILKGKDLENFIKLCAWYICEGHAGISLPFYFSQKKKKKGNYKEIINLLKETNALGQIEENKRFSKKRNEVDSLYKISAKGLLNEIISWSCGFYAFNKVIPSFIFELTPFYQKLFIETLLKGNGSEYAKYWDYSTISPKLSLSLSLLLAQNNYYFSVYTEEISQKNKNWRDQSIIRIYKEKELANKNRDKRYGVKDFEARICLKKEKFDYKNEFEYDISVDLPQENFIGGVGLLVFHNTPFLNVTLDIKVPNFLANQPVIIGGKPQSEIYSQFQEEMDILNKAFYECLMEGDAKGRPFSVDGDCLCPIKNPDKIRLVKIGNYIDDLMEKKAPVFIKENNCQVLDVRGLNLKSLGYKNGIVDWQKINFLVRHPIDSLLKISTVGGFSTKVTPSHSTLVLKDGQIQSFEASKLSKGDYLIAPKTVPQGENKISKISLVEEFVKKGKEKGIYVRNVVKDNLLYQEERIRPCNNSSYKVSTYPLINIKERLKEFDFSAAKLNLKGSAITIANYLPITKELVKFLGWYCAEGSAEKNEKYGGISLGFNLSKEKQTAFYVGNLVKKIWPEIPIVFRKIPKRNLIEIRIHSKIVRRIITEIFEIGNEKEKRVPQIIFETSPEMKKIFLQAYFKGDAWLTNDIVVTSISRELVYGISTLLKQLNIFHTLNEYKWQGRDRWRVNIWRNKKLNPKDSNFISKIPIKESGLGKIIEEILEKEPYFYDSLNRKYKNSKSRILQKFGISHQSSVSLEKVKRIIEFAQKLNIEISSTLKEIKEDNLSFLKIKKLEEVRSSNGMVYDFSTESENFIADQLLVHNTFPIPTVSITKDFDWNNPALNPMWEATAKYGVNYFQNFVQSDMNPEDFRSMCCRLRLSNKELYKRGGGLFGSAPLTGCYDEKTEILTENGWKFFKDLTKEENVFTLTESNKVELHRPQKLFQYDYKGEMYQFKTKSLDLLVTPNHRMVVDNRRKNQREFVEAKDFQPDAHWIPKQGIWEGEEKKYFELPPVIIMGGAGPVSHFSEEELETIRKMKEEGRSIYRIAENFNCNPVTIYNVCVKENYGNREKVRVRYEASALKIKMDDWLKFFGFWLAEGCTDNEKIAQRHGYRTIITQVNEEKKKEFKEVLDSLPFNYYLERGVNFVISNKQLWSYLRQFGNKYQKFIPKEIKSLSQKQLKILFDWLVKGDGHIREKTTGQINYWTSSKKLADDLQEIILKLGWLGTLTFPKKKVSQIKGRKIKGGIVYTLGVQKTKHYRLRKNNPQKIFYQGKVYCCEVLNHTVFVRRNGKVSWCGNSIGVVTINLPRIGYLSKTKKEFFERLTYLMDLAKESLEIKRKALEDFMEKGLYPYSKYYLSSVKKIRNSYFGNHFSTIGLLGMNEALLNFIGENIGSKRGIRFASEVLDFMRERLVKYQEETGNLYNLEATPGEGTSYRQAKADKERYPDIITAGTKEKPYYTNSSQLPVNYTDDVFEALKLQDETQCKYTGGVVFHAFLGERVSNIEATKNLIKNIFNNFHLPYITLTPTFSICPVHGYLDGEHFECPKCAIKQPCEVYSRVVGYLRPVSQWNIGKQQEFKERKEFKIKKTEIAD